MRTARVYARVSLHASDALDHLAKSVEMQPEDVAGAAIEACLLCAREGETMGLNLLRFMTMLRRRNGDESHGHESP